MQHRCFTWVSWYIIRVFELFFLWSTRILLKTCFCQPLLLLFEILKSVNFIFFSNVFWCDVDARLLHRVFWQALEILMAISKLLWNFDSDGGLAYNRWLICSISRIFVRLWLIVWFHFFSPSLISRALHHRSGSLWEQVAVSGGHVDRTKALSDLKLFLLVSLYWRIGIWTWLIDVINNWLFIYAVFTLFSVYN